ncbi:hypothetical protein [Streptomyces sp. NBC_01727]|uniref:hypothetical protein n=1 Tax=Streptomyces sp. NBC_01727 TaxID=2975924 RepID=UPI002E1202D8|nr:hypothetical protein OIE76_44080 [Streptomyces sp. NBC_01727]
MEEYLIQIWSAPRGIERIIKTTSWQPGGGSSRISEGGIGGRVSDASHQERLTWARCLLTLRDQVSATGGMLVRKRSHEKAPT